MNGYTEIIRKNMLEKYELCESVRRVKWTINKDEDGEITYDITTYDGSGEVKDEYTSIAPLPLARIGFPLILLL